MGINIKFNENWIHQPYTDTVKAEMVGVQKWRSLKILASIIDAMIVAFCLLPPTFCHPLKEPGQLGR